MHGKIDRRENLLNVLNHKSLRLRLWNYHALRRLCKPAAPESKVARRAQLCASHWVQGSAMPPAAQAIIPSRIVFVATFLLGVRL
jgi:hypothetical protein